MCMGALSACMPVYHMCVVTAEARGECGLLVELQMVLATFSVLGIEPRSSERATNALSC
jgi:hypothetical protein